VQAINMYAISNIAIKLTATIIVTVIKLYIQLVCRLSFDIYNYTTMQVQCQHFF